MKCKGQIAIVTGGASGIGRAIALTLANEGGRVAVWDVNEGQAASNPTEISSAGILFCGLGFGKA